MRMKNSAENCMDTSGGKYRGENGRGASTFYLDETTPVAVQPLQVGDYFHMYQTAEQ